jgi:DNA-directed RNA polymerase III subunit RPC2
MGVQSDKEIAQLICGNDHDLLDLFAINIEESSKLKIYTQKQALDFVGSKVKVNRKISAPRRPWVRTSFELSKSFYQVHNQTDS